MMHSSRKTLLKSLVGDKFCGRDVKFKPLSISFDEAFLSPIFVSLDDTIDSVKEKIQFTLEIPIQEQRLMYTSAQEIGNNARPYALAAGKIHLVLRKKLHKLNCDGKFSVMSCSAVNSRSDYYSRRRFTYEEVTPFPELQLETRKKKLDVRLMLIRLDKDCLCIVQKFVGLEFMYTWCLGLEKVAGRRFGLDLLPITRTTFQYVSNTARMFVHRQIYNISRDQWFTFEASHISCHECMQLSSKHRQKMECNIHHYCGLIQAQTETRLIIASCEEVLFSEKSANDEITSFRKHVNVY